MTSAAAALMVVAFGATFADEALQSGVPIGKSVKAFNPLHITGEDAGEKRCLV